VVVSVEGEIGTRIQSGREVGPVHVLQGSGHVPDSLGGTGLGLDLGEDRFHDLAMYIGQAIVPTLEFIRESFVVDAQEMEDRGLKVVDMDRAVNHVVSKIVC